MKSANPTQPYKEAILWLGSEPVNSMTLELWTALGDALTVGLSLPGYMDHTSLSYKWFFDLQKSV